MGAKYVQEGVKVVFWGEGCFLSIVYGKVDNSHRKMERWLTDA